MRRLLDADSNFHVDTRWRSGCGLRRIGDKYGPERTSIVRLRCASEAAPTNHAWIGDPMLADAILDRLVHNAHKLTLKGPSRRKQNATETNH